MGQVFGRTGVKEPAYEVLYHHTKGFPYEIRRYGERFVAETTYGDGSDDSSPFMALARYIGVFGKPENEGNTQISMTAPVAKKEGTAIAMTAPVSMKQGEGGQKVMDFFLPAEYDSLDKIPKPTNPKVVIKEVPPAVGAVHRYSGRMNDDEAKRLAEQLAAELEKSGAQVDVAQYEYWGYNPPFTLPMFRRNEVWIPMDQQQAESVVNGIASEAN